MLTPGDMLQKRYTIKSLLGKGGYGAVYEAYHHHLQHTVAIKEMHDLGYNRGEHPNRPYQHPDPGVVLSVRTIYGAHHASNITN